MNEPESRAFDSKFRFILLAANRAEQVMRGARPKIVYNTPKVAKGAMKEVKGGLIEWDYGPAPLPEPEDLEQELAEGAEATESE
jgi:hypothetical protein